MNLCTTCKWHERTYTATQRMEVLCTRNEVKHTDPVDGNTFSSGVTDADLERAWGSLFARIFGYCGYSGRFWEAAS